MIAPREVAEDLYLETNESAATTVKKIRFLLNLCSVDYKDVLITYATPCCDDKAGKNNSPIVSSEEKDNQTAKLSFNEWMAQTRGMTEEIGNRYNLAINIIDKFVRKNNFGCGFLCGSSDDAAAVATIDALLEFLDQSQRYRFHAALRKYREFLIEAGAVGGKRPSIDERSRVRKTLELPSFKCGFLIDGINLERFRSSYSQVNGVDCPLNDEKLSRIIRRMGFEFEGKVYLIDDEGKEYVRNVARQYDDSGANIIYYDKLFELNANEFFEANVLSAEMLKSLLEALLPRYRYKKSYFSTVAEKRTELELLAADVRRVWGDGLRRTLDELEEKLPLIPVDKLKYVLSQDSGVVLVSKGTYIQTASFDADEEELSRLEAYIEEKCRENGSVSFDEIPFDDLRTANADFSDSAFWKSFCKLLEDRFERNGKVLTRKGEGVDARTAVKKYCAGRSECSYDELAERAEQVSGRRSERIIVEAANSAMVRIGRDKFVADDRVKFDVDGIDLALDAIAAIGADGFVGLKEITTFAAFPYCGYGWNLFLLESYCRRFSAKYRYETRRANSSNVGVVAAKTCALSYPQMMARALARSGRELTRDSASEYLIEAGYAERIRRDKLGSLLKEAEKLRGGRS